MRRELSIYLDLLRVAAALLVFLGHLSWAKLSGGALWPLQRLGHDGVIVFFVLSGFVIQYVTMHKETGLHDYAVARLARLYSVVLPALLLTLLCDQIGQNIRPDIYISEDQTMPGLRLLAGGLFLSQSWGWNLTMLSNVAFWSLPYEFWYYQIFGAALFLRGRQRIFWVTLGCIMAGPAILLYFPIWLFGAAAFFASTRTQPGRASATLLFVISSLALLGLLVLEALRLIPRVEEAAFLPPSFSPVDYVTGALVAVNLYAAAFVPLPLGRLGKPIAYLAGFTFALYLFHMPLLHLAATVVPSDWPVSLRGLAAGSFSLLAVFLLGLISERKKAYFARLVARTLKPWVGAADRRR